MPRNNPQIRTAGGRFITPVRRYTARLYIHEETCLFKFVVPKDCLRNLMLKMDILRGYGPVIDLGAIRSTLQKPILTSEDHDATSAAVRVLADHARNEAQGRARRGCCDEFPKEMIAPEKRHSPVGHVEKLLDSAGILGILEVHCFRRGRCLRSLTSTRPSQPLNDKYSKCFAMSSWVLQGTIGKHRVVVDKHALTMNPSPYRVSVKERVVI